jgi:hypothetical protein
MKKQFTWISAAIIILSATSASVKAQPWNRRVKGEGFGGPTVGAMNTNLADINNAMNAAGYGSFKNTQPLFGGLGYGMINDRVMLGGWGGFNEQTAESQTNKAKMDYAVGFFDAGYAVMNTAHYKLIPFIGVGGGGYSLKLYPIDQGSPEFHNVLSDPRRTASMMSGYAAIDLGLSNHFSFDIFDRLADDNLNTFKMGGSIRVGAFYPVARSDWKFEDEGTVFKGPAVGNKPVFYGSLTVLFGGSTKKAPCDKAGKAVMPGQTETPVPAPAETPKPEPEQKQ